MRNDEATSMMKQRPFEIVSRRGLEEKKKNKRGKQLSVENTRFLILRTFLRKYVITMFA